MLKHSFLFVLTALALLCADAAAQVAPDDEIRRILAERIGKPDVGIGAVVGVIDRNGRRVIGYGSMTKNDKRPLNGDTAFEIGSITKVFTSLLLMDMVRRNEVSLTDPVSKYLPAGVKIPERNGRKITLGDLATQTSGLPRMPTNFAPKDSMNPYADYSVQQMYDFLSGYQLTRDIGSQYEYSNLGVGLLGHALSLRAQMSYEDLVRSRICDPLGMKNTRVTLTPAMKANLATGHSAAASPVPNWDIPTLAGAGALRSTANDLLTFLAANLGYQQSPLARAMADQVSIRHATGMPDMQIAYGWHVQTKDESIIIWHNGGTGGYRSYIGYDPKARTGVVVLANYSTPEGPGDIGRHLLNASYPLLTVAPPVEHHEITLDTNTFDRYVGSYQLGPYALLAVSRNENHFYTQLTGQPKLEIFAESDRKFFLKAVDAQLTFDVDEQGSATQAILHQNGADIVAKRLNEPDVKRFEESLAAHQAEVEKRAKEQRPSPGTEDAVRRSIQELQAGEPNYALMSPQLAAATRQQLPQIKTLFNRFGALQSIAFKGVGPGGADIYDVKFEHGQAEWRIVLGPDGKTQGLSFRPL